MVRPIRKILFASDLTEDSRHAFASASSAAAIYGAEIVLLHVLERLPAGVQYRLDFLTAEGVSGAFRASRKKGAKEVLIGKRSDFDLVNMALAKFYGDEHLGDRQFHEACEVVIVEGRVPDEIIEAAEEHGCDMIVLGAHKRRLGGTAVGSVSKHVLQKSRVPVLIVPPREG